MSYIGRGLQSGAFRQLDDISSGFDGSDTTHTMQVNSTNVTVGDVNQILLSLGGVIQKPGTDFTVSGSVLTFTTAPAANTSFFAVLLGSDNGGTVTPTDSSVTTAKIVDDAVTGAKLADDIAITTTGTITTQGTGTTGGTIEIENTDTSGANGDFIGKINFKGNDSSSSASGTRAAIEAKVVSNFGSTELHFKTAGSGASATDAMVIDSDGAVTKPLQPAFHAQLNTTATNISINAYTIPIMSVERFDRGGDYNTSTYEFTCPVAGLYHFEAYVRLQELDSAANYYGMRIEGSNLTIWNSLFQTAGYDRDPSYYDMRASHFVDCDAGDQVYVRIYQAAGTNQVDIGEGFFSGRLVC